MYYIGVDLGGTNIAVGIVNENGDILLKESIPTLRQRSDIEIINDLIALCEKLISKLMLSFSDIVSIGIGSPGIMDPVNGILIYANNLNFDNTPISKIINSKTNVPVYINNDANCAALGESICGAAKGYKNSITITLGTGLGGGLVLNGKIFSGSFFGGGEFGHQVLVVDGEPCTCGRFGCFETYSSATALIRETRTAAARYPDSAIFKMVNGDIRLIDAKTPFDAAELGDKIAIKIIDNYIKYLSEGIANLINIIQPEIIVIGGGVCAQGDSLLIPLRNNVYNKIYGSSGNNIKIEIAQLGNDAGIIGAALQG